MEELIKEAAFADDSRERILIYLCFKLRIVSVFRDATLLLFPKVFDFVSSTVLDCPRNLCDFYDLNLV